MNIKRCCAATVGFAAVILTALSAFAQGAQFREKPEWGKYFSDQGVAGTIVVVDERNGSHLVFDATRASTRFIPASTFKIPHALFALDAGIVSDEFQVFKWDGKKRDLEGWNRDQTLRSSMRYSVVWVYQEFAVKLGGKAEKSYLEKTGYGNADPSGGIDRFWLDGGLKISAFEQVEFLRRLYRNELPFKKEHQLLVKDIMIVEAGKEWILRAKTGWGARMEKQVGWWVGWVELPDGPVFFALNIEMPGGGKDAPKRESIARVILASIGALKGK